MTLHPNLPGCEVEIMTYYDFQLYFTKLIITDMLKVNSYSCILVVTTRKVLNILKA